MTDRGDVKAEQAYFDKAGAFCERRRAKALLHLWDDSLLLLDRIDEFVQGTK